MGGQATAEVDDLQMSQDPGFGSSDSEGEEAPVSDDSDNENEDLIGLHTDVKLQFDDGQWQSPHSTFRLAPTQFSGLSLDHLSTLVYRPVFSHCSSNSSVTRFSQKYV